MLLSITAPASGFSVTLDGHTWLFDRDARIVGALPPPAGHLPLRHPENCPGCVEFVLRGRAQAE